jgi:hypothetical protein
MGVQKYVEQCWVSSESVHRGSPWSGQFFSFAFRSSRAQILRQRFSLFVVSLSVLKQATITSFHIFPTDQSTLLKISRAISHVNVEVKTNVSKISLVFNIRADVVNEPMSLIFIPVYRI